METDNISYKNILDSMCDGVYFVDRNRRIIYWNKAAEDLTGYKSSEVTGKHCRDNILVHVDDTGKNLCEEGCPLQKSIIEGSAYSSSSPPSLRIQMSLKSPFPSALQ